MSLLAGLCAGLFVYLLVGLMTGYAPSSLFTPKPKAPRRKVQRQAWLHQAGLPMTPTQFWVTSIGGGLVTFVLLMAITGAPVVALFPALAVGSLPRAYFGVVRRKKARERQEAWPDALRTIAAGISASQSLHQALRSLATGGPLALRPVFARYNALASTLDQRAALEAIKEDLADPISDRVIEVLVVATDAGPSVVLDILRDLADATTADLQLQERLVTQQTEQRLNSRAVLVLPFLLLIFLNASNESFRDFYSSPMGFIVIMIGTGMLFVGTVMVQRLGRIPGEERVLQVSEVPR